MSDDGGQIAMNSAFDGLANMVGQVVAEYRLERFLGAGVIGGVYLGKRLESAPAFIERTGMQAIVVPEIAAIKLLRLPWQMTRDERDELTRRFDREAHNLRRLQHPSILPTILYGEDFEARFLYLVMPYMPGGSLATLLERYPTGLPLEVVVTILASLASGIDYAHSLGVLHRDLKPSNVLFDDSGNAYIADFAIMRLFEEVRTRLTMSGRPLESWRYSPPEVLAGSPAIGASSDIYSLGMMLYEMVTGQLPYATGSDWEILSQKSHGTPVPPAHLRREVSGEAEAVILRALQPDPARRFATAMELAKAFSREMPAHTHSPSQRSALGEVRARQHGAGTAADTDSQAANPSSHQGAEVSTGPDPAAWRASWGAVGQPWRTEPEINAERQQYLNDCRAHRPDIAEGSFPFSRVEPPLGRADIEWLLATHESDGYHGPIDWADEGQRSREGLDLRGANLQGINLSGLPLARVRGGMPSVASLAPISDYLQRATLHLEGADLSGAHLEGADLRSARLDDALLQAARLEEAHLAGSQMRAAVLADAHLERALLVGANLQGAVLFAAHLMAADLLDADLSGADLANCDLEGADLRSANLVRVKAAGARFTGANLFEARLEHAKLFDAQLDGADLAWAHLNGADLRQAHLSGANLFQAHLEGANLQAASLTGRPVDDDDLARLRRYTPSFQSVLAPANLQRAYFDSATLLDGVVLGDEEMGSVSVADVHWADVNLAVVDWQPKPPVSRRRRQRTPVLGDEVEARRRWAPGRKRKDASTRLTEYDAAVRANRQLAVALRAQGLTESADQFAYRAQKLQRQVHARQGYLGRYLGSLLLDWIAGYGYKPMRSIIAYILIVCLFAGAYLLNAQFAAPHLSWDEALVLSISSFHGRGFFTTGISLGDTLARLAAGEAIIGLLIEITFIATFTQRFFAR